MVHVSSLPQPSVVELAQAGNFRAIAYWLNSQLIPQGVYAQVDAAFPGCLQILVEFHRAPEQDLLVRFICHRLWHLNSEVIEGARIAARFMGESQILWQQTVRITTPANRERQQRSQKLKLKHRRSSGKLKWTPSQLVSGSALAAFLLGCSISYYEVLAYRSPNAGAQLPIPDPATTPATSTANRSSTVQAALETVPVVQHRKHPDSLDPSVTLMFAGDVTLADAFADFVGPDYSWAFADLDEYRQADVSMVNLENPLTRATTPLPDKQFNFKADPESVEVLTEGGVDIVTLANNHAMDYESAGLIETLETLNQAGIYYIGAGRDITEARRPQILEVKGQRIAYLGYYDADFHAAEDGVAGTNPLHRDRLAEDIRAIRNQVDWIVVNFHWGIELAEHPGDWQIDLAHFSIDQGADLVVGHHPHVLQGAEIYKGRPIAYSLGNFIFGGNSRRDYDTAVLKVALNSDRQMKVEFLPIEVTDYQPRVVSGDRGDAILQHINDVSYIFDQPMRSPVVIDARTNQTVAVDDAADQLNTSDTTDTTDTTDFSGSSESSDTSESSDLTQPVPPAEISAPSSTSSSDEFAPPVEEPFAAPEDTLVAPEDTSQEDTLGVPEDTSEPENSFTEPTTSEDPFASPRSIDTPPESTNLPTLNQESEFDASDSFISYPDADAESPSPNQDAFEGDRSTPNSSNPTPETSVTEPVDSLVY